MKLQRFLIITSFLFLLPFVSSSQENRHSIGEINFTDLQKCNPSYLKQILKFKENDHPTLNNIQSDVQRLKNSPGIGNALVTLDTIDQKINITYHIEEIQTLLPVLNLGGIKDNLWFQVGFTDNNWGGNGQLLTASYQNNDGLHSGQIFFRNPKINGSNWGYSVSLSKWTSLEPLYFDEGGVDYIYENNSFALSGLKNFGDHNSLELGGNFFIEKYTKSNAQNLENPPGPENLTQNKFLSKIEYSQNHLNYDFFYRSGFILKSTYQNVYNSIDKTLFNSLQFQGIGYYRPAKKINLALRLKLGISSNNDSPFAPFVADSHVNIRGIGNRIDRGTAQAVLNLEYRQTLFTKRRWSSQFVAFSDLGTWRNPGGEILDLFDPDQFRHFVGGGFRLIYQKIFNAVIRIDYGIDVFNEAQRGLVIGLGQYF